MTEGTTVLLTTQYMEEAEHLTDAIAVLDAGRVAAHGTADQLKDRLGGNMLEVRVTRREDLEQAAALVASLGSAAPRLNPDERMLGMPVRGGPQELIAAGRALEDNGIKLDELGVRRPTLDDVFLALTADSARIPALTGGAE